MVRHFDLFDVNHLLLFESSEAVASLDRKINLLRDVG
jgi:hypothetical protein